MVTPLRNPRSPLGALEIHYSRTAVLGRLEIAVKRQSKGNNARNQAKRRYGAVPHLESVGMGRPSEVTAARERRAQQMANDQALVHCTAHPRPNNAVNRVGAIQTDHRTDTRFFKWECVLLPCETRRSRPLNARSVHRVDVHLHSFELRLAKVKRVAPTSHLVKSKSVLDNDTLEALLSNRYEVMANYARLVGRVCCYELAKGERLRSHEKPLARCERKLFFQSN